MQNQVNSTIVVRSAQPTDSQPTGVIPTLASDALTRAARLSWGIWQCSGLSLEAMLPLATGVRSIATLERHLKGAGELPVSAVQSICAFGDALFAVQHGTLYRSVASSSTGPRDASRDDFDAARFAAATFCRPTREHLQHLRRRIAACEKRGLPRHELADVPPTEARGLSVQAALIAYDLSRYPHPQPSANDVLSAFDRACLASWIEDADPVATSFALTTSAVRHIAQGLGWWNRIAEDDRTEQLEWLIDALKDPSRRVRLVHDWAMPRESGEVAWFQQYRSIKLYGNELLILQFRALPTRLVYHRDGGARQADVIDQAGELFRSIADGTSSFPVLQQTDAIAFVERRLPQDSWYLHLKEFRRGRAA